MSLKIWALNSRATNPSYSLTGASAVAQRVDWWRLRTIDGISDQMENGDLWTSHCPSHACSTGEKLMDSVSDLLEGAGQSLSLS